VEWSEAIRQQLVEDLYALMKAAGCTQLTKASARGMTLAELLEKFIVGTEQTKDWKQPIKLRPHPSELGPISKMCFLSPERKAAEVLKRRRKQLLSTPSEKSLSTIFTPDYINMSHFIL